MTLAMQEQQPVLLYSKLASFGPAKDRAALPEPLAFVVEVVAPAVRSVKSGAASSPPSLEVTKAAKVNQSKATEESQEEVSSSAQTNYNSFTVFELRRILSQRKLATSGRKAELVQRLKLAGESPVAADLQ